MHTVRVMVLGIGMSVAALLPALAADNTPLQLKPGLWELTSDSEHSGMPPIPPEALAKMSPEQRAKVEAAMKGSTGPQHRVVKHCVTQQDIDRGFEKMDKMGEGKCTRTVLSSTATVREGRFQCSGPRNSSGAYRFEARSPESVVANWNMTMSNGGNTMTMKNNMQGKWLGAECGDVKPH